MANAMKGIIAIWSGAVAEVPFGWKLCDGNNGTPDLRDKFVIGAALAYAPGATGGDTRHRHYGVADPHDHQIPAGSDIAAGSDFAHHTDESTSVGYVNYTNDMPPYYALCYIMHI